MIHFFTKPIIDEKLFLIHNMITEYSLPADEIYSQGNDTYEWEDVIEKYLVDDSLDPYEISKLFRYIAKTYPEQFAETLENYVDTKNQHIREQYDRENEYIPYTDPLYPERY